MLSSKQKIKRVFKRIFNALLLIGRLSNSLYWPYALFLLVASDAHPLPTVPPTVAALASHAVTWAQHLIR